MVEGRKFSMELSDDFLMSNLDWDPVYLERMFNEDFNSCRELWKSNLSDTELVDKVEEIERYCPITEDISIEDEVLCSAVEKIEDE